MPREEEMENNRTKRDGRKQDTGKNKCIQKVKHVIKLESSEKYDIDQKEKET